jgi:hypothetical protein
MVIAAKFDSADEFSEGLANITIKEKYGYIDQTGDVAVEPKFEFSSGSYRCARFVEGRACFERGGKIGYIDTKGKVIIEPQFQFVTAFSGGVAQVDFGAYPDAANQRFPIDDNYGLIDRSGRVIYKPANKPDKPVHEPEPVDPTEYSGWQKIQGTGFSFYAPNDLKGGKVQGIDTTVYRFESPELTVSFDIGFMANPKPSYPSQKSVIIDGLEATVWHSVEGRNVSGLYVALGANRTKDHFNMYVSYRDQKLKEIAEKMFRSLRFN